MAWILVAVLAVIATGLGVAVRQARHQRDRAQEGKGAAEARLGALEAESAAAERTAADRVAALEAEVAAGRDAAQAGTAAVAAQAVAEARLGTVEPRLAALWALALLEQQRTWRLSLASPNAAGPDGLAGALAMEVDRIREEVGTPGTLELRLDPPVATGDAALALLAARELLAALVPHTQSYDVVVGREGPRLSVDVVCTGWEGPTEAADDVSRLLAAVAPTGGDLQLDADTDGRLLARLQIDLAG